MVGGIALRTSDNEGAYPCSCSVVPDGIGRRRVFLNGVCGKGCFAVIDPQVWTRLHARNPDLSDVELLELHHDDFAHGAMAFMQTWPNRLPIMVGLIEMRMVRPPYS